MPFRFTFTLTEQDAYDFNMHYFKHAPNVKRQIIITRAIFVIFVLAKVFFSGTWEEEPFRDFVFAGIVLLASQLLVRPLLKWSYMRNLKRTQKSGRLIYDKESTVEFDDDGLTEVTPDSRSNKKYSIFTRAECGETAIYLFACANMAEILPNRVFACPEERETFLAFVRGKIQTAKDS